jgi:hypothetical protein
MKETYMSKNLTRKGIALGAVIALGTTLFAGAPAFAADELTLAPSAGTGYKTLEGEAFKLTAAPAPATSQANIGQLKYQVVTTATVTPVVDTTSGSDTLVTSSATQPTNTNVYSADNAAVAGYAQTISLDVTSAVAAGTPATAVVTAFWDANSDGLLTSGEYTSPARTITWVDIADSGAVVALTQPITGDTTATAKLTFGADVNTSQIRLDAVAVQFSNNISGAPGTAVATASPVVDEEAVLNTDGSLGFSGSVSSIDSGDLVSAQATYLDGDSTGFIKAATAVDGATTSSADVVVDSVSGVVVGAPVYAHATAPVSISTTVSSITANTKTVTLAATKTLADNVLIWFGSDAALGSKVVAAATARTLDQIKISATAKTGVKTTATGVADFDTSANEVDGVVAVRSDVTSYDIVVTLLDASSTPAAIANQAVTVNVTDSGVSSDDLVTLNGAAYDGTSKALALTTNASGQVTVSVAASAADATDALVFNATAQNVTSDSVSSGIGGQTTATWTAAQYTAHAGDSNGNVAATTDGAAVSIPVTVVDQWGDAPAAGYDVLATWDAANSNYVAQATTASTSATEAKASLVGGKATLVITDNGTGVGVHNYDISVAKLTGLSYGSAIATISNFEIRIKAAADLTAGLITVTGTGTLNATTKVHEITTAEPLALTTFGTYDQRSAVGTAPSGFATNSVVSLAGNVKTAATATVAAVLVPGAKVTFSGSGLQFKSVVNSNNVYTIDSATVYTDGSGAFNVSVYGNKAGTKEVTITAGGVTQKVTIVFEDADDNTGSALTATSVATIKAGRTLQVSGLLTDKYGNPVAATHGTHNVKFSVTYDGPGLIVGALPTATDANGKYTFRVLLGAFDAGVAATTVVYDEDTTVTSVAAITATASTLVGVSATVAAAKKAASVSVKNAAGLTVTVVSGTKSVTKIATSDDYKVSLTKLTAGKKTVKVYVNDVLVASKSVTVKK